MEFAESPVKAERRSSAITYLFGVVFKKASKSFGLRYTPLRNDWYGKLQSTKVSARLIHPHSAQEFALCCPSFVTVFLRVESQGCLDFV